MSSVFLLVMVSTDEVLTIFLSLTTFQKLSFLTVLISVVWFSGHTLHCSTYLPWIIWLGHQLGQGGTSWWD